MSSLIAYNIISPLGRTAAQNFDAVRAGKSGVRLHKSLHGLRDDVVASVISESNNGSESVIALAEESVREALSHCEVDAADESTVFVISTTKGGLPDATEQTLSDVARAISRRFDNPNQPVVISNACVSGVSAQIVANRLLESGRYATAIVVGVDLLSRFIVSGFMSFKALSDKLCMPFDAGRTGLNLGEGAATMILSNVKRPGLPQLVAGSMHNDANHISGPSRTGEGSYRVLCDLLMRVNRDQIAFVSPHGTATVYNDEMESIALHRAGLDSLPVTPLKAVYGHTLGAAGVIETIIACEAMRRQVVIGTGREVQNGVSHPLDIPDVERAIPQGRDVFIKLISGFGGINAGVAYKMA